MKTFIVSTLIGIIIIFAEGKPLEETTSTQTPNNIRVQQVFLGLV